MLDICSICLRTGIELRNLEEALSNFQYELCDFETDINSLCCLICAHLLRKCYNFRNKCQKANYVLNKWKKTSKIARISLNELHTQLSPYSLGLSNNTNCAVYSYSTNEGDTEIHLDNFNSCYEKDVDSIKLSDIISEKNIAGNFEIALKVEPDVDHYLDEIPIALDELKPEPQYVQNDISYSNIVLTNDGDNHAQINIKVVSESTNDEKKQTYKRKKITTEGEQKKTMYKRKKIKTEDVQKQTIYKRKTISKQDMEETKRNVKRRLESGDVKDKDGNVIEADVILNNLDKIHGKTCAKIWRNCTGKEPLTPEAIELLGQMQKRFGNKYSSVFITKHLTTDDEIMDEFRKKELDPKYLQAEYKCTRCFKYFKFVKLMEYHIAQFHDASKPHRCVYCDMRFHRVATLKHHEVSHRVVYQCKLCPFVTSYMLAMESHFNMHKGVKYPCKLCSSVFRGPSGLCAHMNRAHHVGNLICPYCARKFHNKQGLDLHKKKKHLNDIDTVGPPSAKCEQCNIHFVSDEVYMDHMRKSHFEPDRLRFPRNYPIKKKKCSDATKRPPRYTCRECRHVESSMGALMVHFKSKHPSEEFHASQIALREPHHLLCHVCGKGFSDITKFTYHKNVHSDARPFACTECPKAFHDKYRLANHMKIHLPPTYQCPQCGKKFHSAANLSNHKRVHTGDRRYACNVCGKAFLHQSAVNEHVRGVHHHIRRTKATKQTHVSEQHTDPF